MSIFGSRQIMFHLFASVMGGSREVNLHLSSMRLNEINIVMSLIRGCLKLCFTLILPIFPKQYKKALLVLNFQSTTNRNLLPVVLISKVSLKQVSQ